MVQIEEADFNSNKILNLTGRTVKYDTLNLIDICVKFRCSLNILQSGLQSRRNFGTRVLSYFITKIMAAIIQMAAKGWEEK